MANSADLEFKDFAGAILGHISIFAPSNLIDKNAKANPPTPIPFANTPNAVEINAPIADPTNAA